MVTLKGLPGLTAWLVYNKLVFGLIFCRHFNTQFNEQSALIVALQDCTTFDECQHVTGLLSESPHEKLNYSMPECIDIFKSSSKAMKESLLMECITFVGLTDEESYRLLALHSDVNGIPIGKANITNYDSGELMDLMLKTLVACSEVNTDFGLMNTEDVDDLAKMRVDIRDEANEVLSRSPETETGNVIVLALKKVAARLSFTR